MFNRVQEIENKNQELNKRYSELTKEVECYFVSVGMPADVPNRNGIIYPKAVLERAIKDYTEKTAKKQMFVWINRDNEKLTSTNSVWQDIVAIVEDCKIINDELKIRLKYIDTPVSKNVKELVKYDLIDFSPGFLLSGDLTDFRAEARPSKPGI